MYHIDLEHTSADVSVFRFPGGEPHAVLPELHEDVYIHAGGLQDWRCLENLLVILNALSFQETVEHVFTYMPYFPGARQDRTDGFTPKTVALVAGMLAAATFNDDDKFIFYTFDIHSEIALAAARSRIELVNLPVSMLDGSQFDQDITGIIAPDKGAIDRATAFRDTHFPDAALLHCEKDRNFKTGFISGYKIPEIPDEYNKWLVVDDICDGGATFNALAGSWDQHTDATLQLYISHGIFSKGLDNISSYFEKIYTTDSVTSNIHSPRLVRVTLPTPHFPELKENNVPSTFNAAN